LLRFCTPPSLTCMFALESAQSGKESTRDQTVVDQTGRGGWWSDIVVDRRGGVASADPDLGPAVNTTCTYDQFVAPLNAQDPTIAAVFNSSPGAACRFAAVPSGVADATKAMGPADS
jgi:hypothetical protein